MNDPLTRYREAARAALIYNLGDYEAYAEDYAEVTDNLTAAAVELVVAFAERVKARANADERMVLGSTAYEDAINAELAYYTGLGEAKRP